MASCSTLISSHESFLLNNNAVLISCDTHDRQGKGHITEAEEYGIFFSSLLLLAVLKASPHTKKEIKMVFDSAAAKESKMYEELSNNYF